ncbi:MAG TPA: MG2 domain-containing protein, partial [Chitinivibrionales bacterium]
IDFYSTDDNGLTRPATEFFLNSVEYFKPFEKFIHLKLATVDTASLKFRALRLLQQLTFFHAENNELEALIDADLQRLSFVRQNAALADKDSLYLKALISLESLAPYSPASAEIIYKIASLHREWADSYVWKKNDRYRWMNTAALRLCDKAIQSFAGSYGARQCAALKAQIRAKSLSCTIETVNPPHAAFRALVSYKNTEKIFWRCIAIPMEDYQRISGAGGDSMAAKLLTIKPASAWSTTLPSPEDYQNHSAEVEIPGLPPGHYAILCSPDSLFRLPLQSLGFASTQISKLSFVERRLTSGDQEFIVADRATGAPLKGVLATVSVRVYNGTTPQPVLQFKEAVKSDKDGRIRIRAGAGGFENCVIDFSYGIDRLRAGGDYYLYPAAKNAAMERLRTYFFTDRAIYRPGQTMYFKGILLRINGDRVEIAPRENTLVHFYDVNGQEVGRLALTSNEFGSIHGSFIAPSATLSGQMYLTDGRGSAYVSVEEYKRPKFEVRLDAPPDCPTLGEIVTCTGHAKAYAGNAIDGAKVTY